MYHRQETLELAQLPVSEEYSSAELSSASTHQPIQWVIATGRWRTTAHFGSSPFSGATARVILSEDRRARPYLYVSGGWRTRYATAPPPPERMHSRGASTLSDASARRWLVCRRPLPVKCAGGAPKASLGQRSTHEVPNPDLYFSVCSNNTTKKLPRGPSASAMLRRNHTID